MDPGLVEGVPSGSAAEAVEDVDGTGVAAVGRCGKVDEIVPSRLDLASPGGHCWRR